MGRGEDGGGEGVGGRQDDRQKSTGSAVACPAMDSSDE